MIPYPPSQLSSQPLTIHFDFVTAHAHPFRITVSSFFDNPRMAGSSTLRIPFSAFCSGGESSRGVPPPWTVVAIDIRATVKKFAPDVFSNDRVSHLRCLKVCSYATLFGSFTSDLAFDTEGLCKNINVAAHPPVFKWLPTRPKVRMAKVASVASSPY